MAHGRKWMPFVAAGLACSVGLVVAPAIGATASDVSVSVVERSGCSLAAPARAGRPARFEGFPVQTVTVTVQPLAIVHLDGGGRVVAATTNTGCAPRNGDALVVIGPGDRPAPVPPGLKAQLWVGDFTVPGRLVPQGGAH